MGALASRMLRSRRGMSAQGGWVEITSVCVEVRHVLIGATAGKTHRAA